MARPLVTFLRTQDWGTHPLEWHTVRQWDRLSPSDQPYAKRQHWARADMMEGAKGNGLEFLAIHRSMIRLLTARFPKNGDLFAGWTAPPTVNGDANDPSTDSAAFDPSRSLALDKLQNHLADFETNDELGLYIETTLRPTMSDPNARAADKSAGLHNYLHYRFQDGHSKIDMGDPSVNLQNKRFWRVTEDVLGRPACRPPRVDQRLPLLLHGRARPVDHRGRGRARDVRVPRAARAGGGPVPFTVVQSPAS
jgi:hypothetical protein